MSSMAGSQNLKLFPFVKFAEKKTTKKQEMLQYVTNAPEGPLCAIHLLIMLYLSVMFR